MAKHRLKQDHGLSRSVRGVLVFGAVSVGAVALPAAPAVAQTITIPGFGNVEIPDVRASEQLPPLPEQLPPVPEELAALPEQLPPVPELPPMPELPALPSAPSSTGLQALQAAESKVGAPYVYGAAGPNMFDCSGLTQWAYEQAGVDIPRTTYGQADAGISVAESDLQPGDVVILEGGGHAGLYAGDGNIVHASTEGEPVKYGTLDSMSFTGARRF